MSGGGKGPTFSAPCRAETGAKTRSERKLYAPRRRSAAGRYNNQKPGKVSTQVKLRWRPGGAGYASVITWWAAVFNLAARQANERTNESRRACVHALGMRRTRKAGFEYSVAEYDTTRDAILTCGQNLTTVSLIYHTELTTKKRKNRKTKK